MDYRNDAPRHVERAVDELATGDDRRLKSAALELRIVEAAAEWA